MRGQSGDGYNSQEFAEVGWLEKKTVGEDGGEDIEDSAVHGEFQKDAKHMDRKH